MSSMEIESGNCNRNEIIDSTASRSIVRNREEDFIKKANIITCNFN